MKRFFQTVLCVLCAICGLFLGGCNIIQPVTTLGADVGTTQLLKGIKDPVKRGEAAQLTHDIAAAVSLAAQSPPDFSGLQKLVSDRVAASKSPYAPLIGQIVLQELAQLQSQATATQPGVNVGLQEFIASEVRAAMVGIELATLEYLPLTPSG